jgi:hypothetical protein
LSNVLAFGLAAALIVLAHALVDPIQDIASATQAAVAAMLTQSGRHSGGSPAFAAHETEPIMRFSGTRLVAVAAGTAVMFLFADTAHAQNSEPKPGTQRQQSEGEGQKKVDEFAEAAKVLGGPAANPECIWIGRRAVSLLWRDDLDTAFRHLDLYDRFGCPADHIQVAFRCLVRQGNIDPKAPETLSGRVHACWINPTNEPVPVPSAAAAPSATTNR